MINELIEELNQELNLVNDLSEHSELYYMGYNDALKYAINSARYILEREVDKMYAEMKARGEV